VSDDHHPVHEVYDLLRRAALNSAYYSKRLSVAKRKLLFYEIALAVAAPSSGIAGLSVLDTNVGKLVWGVATLVASFLAVAKPFLRMSDQIESYDSTLTEYRSLESELAELRGEIYQHRVFDEKEKEWLRHIRRRMGRVAENEPKEEPDEKLVAALYDKINQQYPADSLFVP
jgi:hypothetical protein